MPELPEVEKARRLVHDLALGSPISRVHRPIIDDKVFVDVAAGQFERALSGRKITHSKRHGKQLWWQLDGNDALVPCFHFGMTGAVIVRGVAAPLYKSFEIDESAWPPRFTKLEIVLRGDVRLAYADPRRFGRILLRGADPFTQPPLSALAADPITG